MDIDPVDTLERGVAVVGQCGLGAGTERAGVVDQGVDRPVGGGDEPAAMPVVSDVARDGHDLGFPAELGRGGDEGVLAAGVKDEPPVVVGELAREGQSETARGAGDDCCGHDRHAMWAAVLLSSGNWS